MSDLKPRAVPQTIGETLELLTGADYVADRSLRFWRRRSGAG